MPKRKDDKLPNILLFQELSIAALFPIFIHLCQNVIPIFQQGCVVSRLVPQLKIKIQDPQDSTPLQDFRIQDPLNPTLRQNFRIQDPLDPTQSQNFRIQDPLDPTQNVNFRIQDPSGSHVKSKLKDLKYPVSHAKCKRDRNPLNLAQK